MNLHEGQCPVTRTDPWAWPVQPRAHESRVTARLAIGRKAKIAIGHTLWWWCAPSTPPCASLTYCLAPRLPLTACHQTEGRYGCKRVENGSICALSSNGWKRLLVTLGFFCDWIELQLSLQPVRPPQQSSGVEAIHDDCQRLRAAGGSCVFL
eukprot:185678-Prymnesium_polylepis.1